MLYYTRLCYAILYYTMLCYTILYYTILYYTILYYTILYYIILRLYHTIILYFTIYIISEMDGVGTHFLRGIANFCTVSGSFPTLLSTFHSVPL